jgi:hypothetical protein
MDHRDLKLELIQSVASISNGFSLLTTGNANELCETLQSSSKAVPSKISPPTLTLAQSGSTINPEEAESEHAQGNITKILCISHCLETATDSSAFASGSSRQENFLCTSFCFTANILMLLLR